MHQRAVGVGLGALAKLRSGEDIFVILSNRTERTQDKTLITFFVQKCNLTTR